MEIQQHDGVVVEVAGIPAGLRQAAAGGGRGVAGGGRRQDFGAAALPLALLYIGPLGWAPALGDAISKGGGGQGGGVPPKPSGAPPPLGFPTIGAGEAHGGGAPAH